MRLGERPRATLTMEQEPVPYRDSWLLLPTESRQSLAFVEERVHRGISQTVKDEGPRPFQKEALPGS